MEEEGNAYDCLYTHAHVFGIIDMQIEKEDIHMSSVMRITSKKVVLSIEQNRKHAARATQVERQVEKIKHIHDTNSWKQANRQGRCVRETEAIIGKAPRLGIRTPSSKLDFHHKMPSVM